MFLAIKNIFGPDNEHYEGVYKINIYPLQLLIFLMFLVVGKSAWTHLLTAQGSSVRQNRWQGAFGPYSVLSVIGIIRPLKMLPIVLLEILYKVLWLILVAYPLWSINQLVGSPAEKMTYIFLWVALPIIAMPWKYAFENYVFKPKKNTGTIRQLS